MQTPNTRNLYQLLLGRISMDKRVAVVIGINNTRFSVTLSNTASARTYLMPLPFAEAAARELAKILRRSGYEVIKLLGSVATREAIIENLEEQAKLARNRGDLLIVYFAGYGDVDRSNRDIAYLLPSDADPAHMNA